VTGHVCTVTEHRRFGTTYQPVCAADGCGYRGPHAQSPARATAIGNEHTRKHAGQWSPKK